MIISHEHKFIFLKTEKTGSSSVESALGQFCGPRDVLTVVHESDEVLHPVGPRNERVALGNLMPPPRGVRRVLPEAFGYYPHIRAEQARRMTPRQVWNSYFKFAVERNPWDRQVSLFRHRQRRRPQLTFDNWLGCPFERTRHYVRLRNWNIYAIGGSIAVDHVIPYERLNEGLAEVLQHLGLKERPTLPRVNGQYRPAGDNYRPHYSDANRQRIERWYRREVETFGYSF
jgi:hypothetical protein